MLAQSLILFSAALAVAQSTEPTSTQISSSSSTPTSSEPCAAISKLIAADEDTFPAKTAYDCLNSVPVNIDGNSKLIDELKGIWSFQSDYKWFKNPPKDWELGPLDIDAQLDEIKKNLTSYKSEYEVQKAIEKLTIRTGNFHFNYFPDILQVFVFSRDVGVASISDDGTSLPKLYVAEDVKKGNSTSSKFSDIKTINSLGAWEYLNTIQPDLQYIDIDGRLNKLMATGDTGSLGDFDYPSFYGESTKMTFSNGTSRTYSNTAYLRDANYDFKNVTDGKSFYAAYCTDEFSSTKAYLKSQESEGKIRTPQYGAPGQQPRIPDGTSIRHDKRSDNLPSSYPTAIFKDKEGAVAGYFLNGTGYENVAVLKIITFSPGKDEDTDETGFQSTIRKFLAECVKRKKEKLVLDLRENGGGSTSLLLDSFMQLFPQHEPYSAQRYHATPAFMAIGDAVNEIHANRDMNATFAKSSNSTVDSDYRYWAWWHFRDAQGNNFKSWDDFNGPQTLNNDNYTVTMRYSYSNNDNISVLAGTFKFTNLTALPQPFNASNMIMFTDALCGSACTSFHEELKNIAGVRSVTVGGRPENKPMQAVTGSKGGEVIDLHWIPSYASDVLNLTTTLGLASVKSDNSALKALASTPQLDTRAGDSYSRIQTQDQLRKGDKTGTPLMLIYEAADCKIFYTMDSYYDPEAAWKQAWDAGSNDGKCVRGSTKHATSISGGFKPYGPGKVKSEDLPGGSDNGNGKSGSGTSGSGTGGNTKKAAAPSMRVDSLLPVVVAVVAMASVL
ncbi:hypothetical protein P280DRAFT_473397 [Massarina eburnea CBS 473.64]|uniref:Uncharacterized protein n=1 Tax=Massarina eburnea CBS 473.64 TaxID=1395130 RepID=A0A6A6RLJ6_9PLEO|nr:hypothetical protein P280DRAFT_473397 [Massarina eburnea CBS 473.64]